MSEFPAILDLSSILGSGGFRIGGVSVASAGDVNGDGFDDLVIGASGTNPTAVVFGKADGFGTDLDLSNLTGSNGFKITIGGNDVGNVSVGTAGDINHDGFDDIILGTASGAFYLVFGKASGFSSTLDLLSLDGNNGFRIDGAPTGNVLTTFTGTLSSISAGDINGDGFGDLFFTAGGSDPSYILFGKASGFGATLDLASSTSSSSVQIHGEAAGGSIFGTVSSAGDVNEDGFADLVFGMPYGNLYGGITYVAFGSASGLAANLDLSGLNGSDGFRLTGGPLAGYSGSAVAAAGDVNGDGFADFLIGAPQDQFYSGAGYVIFGKASGFDANVPLSSIDGSNGFEMDGAGPIDFAGATVSGAGDVNGDGFDDVIVTATPHTVPFNSAGASYVVFGKASGFSANLDLGSLDGSNGFEIDGEHAGDYSGWPVSAAGDINGDGFADILIGSPFADLNGPNSGASYVVFGRMPTTAVNRTGTNASQTLAGGDFNDTLTALGGNDMLYGHGGDDTLDGGAGLDTAVFSAPLSAYTISKSGPGATISGPDGTDTIANIEFLRFADTTIHFRPGPGVAVDFNAPPSSYMGAIRDFDGNDLGGASVWKMIGTADVNGDGTQEHILVDPGIERWATVGTAEDGLVYFDDHGWGGSSRVVGIYIDPLVANGTVAQGGPFDSQQRFQNDLRIDNIHAVLGAHDYDGDGLQEIYFGLADGTAYLHAYMHADGNIRYANYQNEQQAKDYLTAHGFGASTWAGWFPDSGGLAPASSENAVDLVTGSQSLASIAGITLNPNSATLQSAIATQT